MCWNLLAGQFYLGILPKSNLSLWSLFWKKEKFFTSELQKFMPENLQEEMQFLQSVVNQAKELDESVYRELKRSQALLEYGFYTEASLRLGRAVEASIYSTARLLGMSVSAVGVKQIGNIANRLNGVQIS